MNDLLAQMMQLAGVTQDWIWVAALVFLRVGAAVFLMPAFGEQSVPQKVRLILALMLTAIVLPAVALRLQSAQSRPFAAAEEVLAGLTLGIGMRLFILALQFAGAIIAQTTSLSQLFGGTTPEPQPAIGNLLTMASLALALRAGLHVKAASLLILSYDFLPAGHFPAAADLATWGLQRIVQATVLAFSLAAPFVIASVLYNLALGVINRTMPQMPVALVGAPLMTAGALGVMAVMVPIALMVWIEGFEAFLANPWDSVP
ncbi:type III secretion protein [bacterium]|nr:type III secretion protein [bacterium]